MYFLSMASAKRVVRDVDGVFPLLRGFGVPVECGAGRRRNPASTDAFGEERRFLAEGARDEDLFHASSGGLFDVPGYSR